MENIFILSIESSCDDTSVAVLRDRFVLSNVTATQQTHKKYGGVVPELASRAHQENIIPTLSLALERAEVSLADMSAIAFTNGPGLLGSLLVGSSIAKSLGLALTTPLIEVNHMQAHILAHFIENQDSKSPEFPFLALTVSGGHTQIVLVKNYLDMVVLGETLDDAVGEAFDKCAKFFGLDYPGGPIIDQLSSDGDQNAFVFAKPKVPGLDFSFSGLKTSVLYFLQKKIEASQNFIQKNIHDLCASLQKTIISILLEKVEQAIRETGINSVAIAGGVSANSGLRAAMSKQEAEAGWKVYIPKFEYTTDNAAMVGIAGYFKYLNGYFCNYDTIPKARWQISTDK